MLGLFSRVEECCKDKGISVGKLERTLGASKGSLYPRKGVFNPGCNRLLEIAKYFNVSTDFLLTGQEFNSPALTAEEKRLLKLFRSVNEQGQKQILKQARYATEESEYKKRDTLSGEVVEGE